MYRVDGLRGLFNTEKEMAKIIARLHLLKAKYAAAIHSFRHEMSRRSFEYDFKVFNYSRVGKVQIYNDLLMRLSGFFLSAFAFNTLPEKYLTLGINRWMLGKHKKSLLCFLRAELLQKKQIIEKNWQDKNFIFLPRNCAHVIGLTGHMDAFIKQKILTDDERTYYILAPEPEIVNKEFLNYWAPYVKIISDPVTINELTPYEQLFTQNWNWAISEGSKIYHVHHGISRIQRQWKNENKKPLLILSEEHKKLLNEQKKAWGLNDKDWFVCLHVRSEGFYKKQDGNTQGFRNTSIDDYYDLINAITRKGGWVFRMGDPSVTPLDMGKLQHPERVIDYAHSNERSQALDVALSASCRLFICSPSGLHMVAKAFGVPSLYINFPLYKGFPHDANSLFLPAFYFSRIKNRVLTINEILSSKLVSADHQCHFDRSRISLKYVNPIDMVEALDEALAFADGLLDLKKMDKAAQKFEQINQKSNTYINGYISSKFANKYASKLGLQQG